MILSIVLYFPCHCDDLTRVCVGWMGTYIRRAKIVRFDRPVGLLMNFLSMHRRVQNKQLIYLEGMSGYAWVGL